MQKWFGFEETEFSRKNVWIHACIVLVLFSLFINIFFRKVEKSEPREMNSAKVAVIDRKMLGRVVSLISAFTCISLFKLVAILDYVSEPSTVYPGQQGIQPYCVPRTCTTGWYWTEVFTVITDYWFFQLFSSHKTWEPVWKARTIGRLLSSPTSEWSTKSKSFSHTRLLKVFKTMTILNECMKELHDFCQQNLLLCFSFNWNWNTESLRSVQFVWTADIHHAGRHVDVHLCSYTIMYHYLHTCIRTFNTIDTRYMYNYV